jgi:hypothetical protein
MAKRKSRELLHVRISNWLWEGCSGILEPGEEILDVSFRSRTSKLGPAGWAIIFSKTVLSQTYTHGIFFPVLGRPTKKEVTAAIKEVRAAIDKSHTRKSLLVTPQEAGSILTGIKRGPVNVPKR